MMMLMLMLLMMVWLVYMQLLDGGAACYNGGESYDELSQHPPAAFSSYLSSHDTGNQLLLSERTYVRIIW